MTLQERVRELASEVAQGRTPTATVRDLLSWYSASRRGYWINLGIRRALTEAGLKTDPDFESAYIDANIKFVLADTSGTGVPTHGPALAPPVPPAPTQEPIGGTLTASYGDPTSRISKLASANRRPLSVAPDEPIARATTLMLTNDFSQLPVMSGEREVKGVISWTHALAAHSGRIGEPDRP